MNSKRLIINMVSNIVSFIVSMGISFLLTPYIITSVGKEAYGFVGLANNFVSYAELITLALNAVASRFITIKIHENNQEEANKYFTSVTIANIITSMSLLIPAIGIIAYMDKIVQVPIEILRDVQILWTLIFMNFLIGLITSTYNVVTFASNRLDLSAKRSIQSNILRVVALVMLFSMFKPNVCYIGLASIICTVFITISNIQLKKKLLPQLKVKYEYFDIAIIRELLSSGIWSVITKLGQILSDGLDLLISNVFISASSMGTLAIAKTIPTAISGLLITVSSVFTPQLTIYYAKNKIDKLVEELNRSMKISGIFTNIALAGFISLGYSFYSLWVPGEDIIQIQILSILTVQGLIVSGVINSLFGIFTITNKLKVNSFVILGTGFLNTVIVYILLKTTNLGVLAIAGVSTTTAIIKNLTFTPMYASKCLNISKKTFYPVIIRYIISSFIITITCCIVSKFINPTTWIELIYVAICCVLVGAIFNYILLLNSKERKALELKLKDIFKNKLKQYAN